MTYKLHALPIWEKGNYRDNQEDSIFPPLGLVTDDARLFMVCDGMGGHEAGEVASGAVVEAMSQRILQDTTPDGTFTDEHLATALADAFDLLDERDPNPDSLKRMGTTMTLLKFHADGATVAHIGDSRIYQFRKVDDKMRVIFKSVDHSLVNDLVKVGEMTEEEARISPLKNRITRAMQSHLENRPKADITHLTDIQAGDYFYLCSDGMLENADDDNLCFIFGHACTDEEKVNMLRGNSEDNRDNHSAMVVHVLSVDAAITAPVAPTVSNPKAPEVNEAPEKKAVSAPPPTDPDSIPTAKIAKSQRPKAPAAKRPAEPQQKRNDWWLYIILAALIAICTLFLPRWCKSHFTHSSKQEHVKTDTTPSRLSSPSKTTGNSPVKPVSPARPAKPNQSARPNQPARPNQSARPNQPTSPSTNTPVAQPPQSSNSLHNSPAATTAPTASPAGPRQQPTEINQEGEEEAVSNETRNDEALNAYRNRQNDSTQKVKK